jgi:thiazole synthase ThiGH ThiG subunit
MPMIDRSQNDGAIGATHAPDAEIDLRLGRHAVALLQAARDAGDPALIAHAEAMAIAVGYALAARESDGVSRED